MSNNGEGDQNRYNIPAHTKTSLFIASTTNDVWAGLTGPDSVIPVMARVLRMLLNTEGQPMHHHALKSAAMSGFDGRVNTRTKCLVDVAVMKLVEQGLVHRHGIGNWAVYMIPGHAVMKARAFAFAEFAGIEDSMYDTGLVGDENELPSSPSTHHHCSAHGRLMGHSPPPPSGKGRGRYGDRKRYAERRMSVGCSSLSESVGTSLKRARLSAGTGHHHGRFHHHHQQQRRRLNNSSSVCGNSCFANLNTISGGSMSSREQSPMSP